MKEIKRHLVLDNFEYRLLVGCVNKARTMFIDEGKPIGVWGTRHYHHLRKANRVLFSQLTINGKMNDYLADIDKQAEDMLSQLVKQLVERDGITEALKATDQMEWVRRMNAVQAQATEIVSHDLIYT